MTAIPDRHELLQQVEDLHRRLYDTGLTDTLAAHQTMVDVGVSAEVALLNVAERVNAGPDDTWSGRCNDARRVYHDGQREALRRLLLTHQALRERNPA